MQSAPAAPRPPGRPRSPEADEAIIRATLELLGEVGYRSLSMEMVRARAGVGKATIYRRHAGKDDLVKSALRHLRHETELPEDSGSLIDDLEAFATFAVSAARATGEAAILPRLLAEVSHDAELQNLFYEHFVGPRRLMLRTLLERAVERGEARPDADVEIVMDLLVGSVIYRGLISGMPPEALHERFVTGASILIRGLRP